MGKMFGVTIKIARKNKKLTQEELAQKVGVQPATVSRWENGKLRNLKLSHIQGLSDALDIPVQRLIDLDNESDTPRATSRAYSFRINPPGVDLDVVEQYDKRELSRLIRYLEVLKNEQTEEAISFVDKKEGDDHEDA